MQVSVSATNYNKLQQNTLHTDFFIAAPHPNGRPSHELGAPHPRHALCAGASHLYVSASHLYVSARVRLGSDRGGEGAVRRAVYDCRRRQGRARVGWGDQTHVPAEWTASSHFGQDMVGWDTLVPYILE